VLVVGDVVGHGLQAALSWANTALIERAGTSFDYVTAACVTYLPSQQLLRWAYAGHPRRSRWMTAASSQRRDRESRSDSTRIPDASRVRSG
jgi:hypothetical protein